MLKNDAKLSTTERLQNGTETEVTALELRQKLDAELSKPADEIDAQLVDSILMKLDDYQPTEEQQAAGWESIVRKVEARRKQRKVNTARRVVGIAAAVVIVIAVFSVGTAKAFRWTFLLKWLEPLAETFGIQTETQRPTPTISPAELVIGETDYSQTEYTALEDMPAEINGYATVPGWVPERFVFSKGWVYQDGNIDHAEVLYTAGNEWLSFLVNIYHVDDQAMTFEYEKNIGEYETISYAGRDITVYPNTDIHSLFASWIDQDASYSISGVIIEAELKTIIDSIS